MFHVCSSAATAVSCTMQSWISTSLLLRRRTTRRFVTHPLLSSSLPLYPPQFHLQLDDMLKYLNKVMYKTRLVDYGLNRVDLIALSSPDDGKRAGVRPGHWNDIVSEARKRHPVNPEDLDPTPPPFDELSVRPSVKTGNRDKEIDDAHDIAKEFERDSRIEKKEDVMEGATVDTPPPTPKPAVVAAPIEDKKRIVLAYVKAFLKVKNNKKIRLIAIPSTGASTVECSFGSRHGAFSFRNEDQYKHVHFTKITHLDEAARLPSEFSRKGDYKDVAADAKVITVMVATRVCTTQPHPTPPHLPFQQPTHPFFICSLWPVLSVRSTNQLER